MKKLKLDLDQIHVSSFTVEKEKGRAGTVRAHSADPQCGPSQMWDSCYSCWPQHCAPQPISWDFAC